MELSLSQEQIKPRLEHVARLAHNVYRAYMTSVSKLSLPYDSLDPHTKESLLDGVVSVLVGAVKSPQQSHENWLRFKADAGWIYGEELDRERKQHPCICSFDNLPITERVKDYLFVFSVQAANQMYEDILAERAVSAPEGS